MALKRITVLISGRGSNLGALIAAAQSSGFGGAVTQVISNRPEAGGLDLARAHAIATTVVEHADRATFGARLGSAIERSEPDLVVLAGFMRLLGDDLVQRHAERMLNIHPSLLPAYRGLLTHRRALADGVRIHGCTVHFVTPDVDVGPIVAQAAVPVLPDDDEERLAARVLAQEHRILPAAVRWFCSGRLTLHEGRVRIDGLPPPDGVLVAPDPDA